MPMKRVKKEKKKLAFMCVVVRLNALESISSTSLPLFLFAPTTNLHLNMHEKKDLN
jgi:hypothetical protein